MNKRYFINTCLFLIGVVFSLIILELFLRFSTEYGIDHHLARGSNFWEAYSGTHRPSKVLGYEPIPNSIPQINSFGMFDREYTLEKRRDTYRIIVLGDSIIAYGVLTRSLADKLNSNLTHTFEVWNCGVGGYNIEQHVNYLKYKAIKYNPDMVIIGFCLNDFSLGIPIVYKSGNNKNGLIEYYNPYSKVNFLMNRLCFRYSYSYRFFMGVAEKFLIKIDRSQHTDEQENVGKLNLSAIKIISDKERIPLVVIIFPFFKPLNKYTEFEKNEYGIMLKVIKDLGISYIDLHPYLMNMNLYQLRVSPLDQVHPSIEGQKIIADIIYEYLKRSHSLAI